MFVIYYRPTKMELNNLEFSSEAEAKSWLIKTYGESQGTSSDFVVLEIL